MIVGILGRILQIPLAEPLEVAAEFRAFSVAADFRFDEFECARFGYPLGHCLLCPI